MDEISQIRTDIYSFSRSLAFKVLAQGKVRHALKLILEPLNYWRNIEVPATVQNLDVRPSDKVLDVGSPKIAALYLWKRSGATTYSTDLFDYFREEYGLYLESLNQGRSADTFLMEVQDARKLTYTDEYFDKIFSISVVEHITNQGDSLAMAEFFRVLKKRGICCISVPYASSYFESFTKDEYYYLKVEKGQPVFYQRHYDQRALQERLVIPSKMKLLKIQYFSERFIRYESLYDRLPYFLKIAFAPLSPLATRFFIKEVDDKIIPKKAATAILTFQK